MPSSPGAFDRRPGHGALAPEPTRARAPDELVVRPQLGGGELPDAPTEVESPPSEPPPAPSGHFREEADSLPPPPPPSQPVDSFAEFEKEEIASESTRIEDRDILAEQSTAILDDGPKLPYLFVEAGKDQGREYVLQEGETSIGRGIDNDVILADVSVSRRHFRIQREGGTITLRDLGSGNGTQLNGRRAHVEALNDGDRIELGETVLVVRVPGAPLPTDASNATHETAVPISGNVPAYGPPPQTLPPVGASTDEMVAPRERTQSVVLPRRLLFVAAAAVAIIGSVIGAAVVSLMVRGSETTVTAVAPRPTPVTTLPTVTPGVAPAALPGAPVAPTAVPIVAPATPVAPTVAPVAVPVAPTLPPAPTTPVPLPPPVEADPVVAPTAPVVAEETAAEPEPRETTRGARTAVRDRATMPTRTGAASGSSGGGRERAVAAYRSSDFDGAARLAREAARTASGRERSSLEQLADNIESFGEIYPRIRSAGTNYASVASVGALAIRLDRAIAGGHHTRSFEAGFVDWLLDQAESSISGDPAGACRRARSASEISSSARSRGLLDRCGERASTMLSEASRAERSDPSRARELYRAVIGMVPNTEEARTAQRRMDALGRARIVDEDE